MSCGCILTRLLPHIAACIEPLHNTRHKPRVGPTAHNGSVSPGWDVARGKKQVSVTKAVKRSNQKFAVLHEEYVEVQVGDGEVEVVRRGEDDVGSRHDDILRDDAPREVFRSKIVKRMAILGRRSMLVSDTTIISLG